MPEKNADIDELRADIKRLREELKSKEQLLREKLSENGRRNIYNSQLTTNEIVQYSRQIILPEIGVQGQVSLKASKVLIVGAGGLGTPAALYLARAGIGEITIIDYDEVELSNLHRQILYSESDIGVPKVDAAHRILQRTGVNVIPLRLHVNSETVEEIVTKTKYDVIIDGSDNVPTRYLLNDVSVIHDIPLVSGSALQMEGQLTVYHYEGGPCYRCLFPAPPPPETVTSCGDGGVLGPVPGVIGVLQALEAIKILTGVPGVLSSRLLLFDGTSTSFRCVKLRTRNTNCAVCGDKPTITSLLDYEQFCGAKGHDKVEDIDILKLDEQVGVEELRKPQKDTIILDVRPKAEYEMCKLANTVNFPFSKIDREDWSEDIKELFKEKHNANIKKVYVVCRRGNDSQRAVARFRSELVDIPVKFYNVTGGLHAFSRKVDSDFPVY